MISALLEPRCEFNVTCVKPGKTTIKLKCNWCYIFCFLFSAALGWAIEPPCGWVWYIDILVWVSKHQDDARSTEGFYWMQTVQLKRMGNWWRKRRKVVCGMMGWAESTFYACLNLVIVKQRRICTHTHTLETGHEKIEPANVAHAVRGKQLTGRMMRYGRSRPWGF